MRKSAQSLYLELHVFSPRTLPLKSRKPATVQFTKKEIHQGDKHAKKELGQYPAILTSHLVNNPYITEQEWLRTEKITTDYKR